MPPGIRFSTNASSYLLRGKLEKRGENVWLSQDEWFTAVCESYLNPPVVVDGKELPGFPSDEIQANTTGQSGVNTLKKAFIFYQDCIETFRNLGAPIKPQHCLLDFGVGWGRIATFFLRELPAENVYGIDVMEEFIQICARTFRNNNFYVTTFHRILARGGQLALTTRGRPFLDYCQSLRGKEHAGYLDALSKMFADFADARSRYDQGEFVHSNREDLAGGDAMTADFYGETFIPEKYARSAYADLFTLEKFFFDSTRQLYPIMFFRKV